jgi:mRNA-decapping enzyme subunit 2
MHEPEIRTIPSVPTKVLEEAGYNLEGQVNEEHFLRANVREQQITLFIVPGVPEDFEFKTRTRKEIGVRSIIKLL